MFSKPESGNSGGERRSSVSFVQSSSLDQNVTAEPQSGE